MRYIIVFGCLTFCQLATAAIPAFTEQNWTISNVLGSGRENYIRYSLTDPKAIAARARIERIFANTIFPTDEIKHVKVFLEETGRSERYPKDQIFIYLNNEDEEILEQISERPLEEPLLRNLYNFTIDFLDKHIGQNEREHLIYHCLHPDFAIRPDIIWRREYNSFDYRHSTSNSYWLISLQQDSCLIKSAKIFDHSPTETDAIVLMDRSFRPTIFKNNLPPISPPESLTNSDERTRIGILDSGLDYNNPLIANSLVRSTSAEFPYLGFDFLENDFRFYDVHFPSRDKILNLQPAYLMQQFYPDHGTGVSYVLAKDAPELAIIPARIINGDQIWGRGKIIHPEIIAKGIDYVVANGAKCVNLSIYMKDGPSDQLQIVTAAFLKHPDVLFVVAAGNGRDDLNNEVFKEWFGPDSIYVKNYPNILLVGALTPNREFASDISNFGNQIVQIGAVGVGEGLPRPGGQWQQRFSGTSYATPLVTKTCGKIRHRWPFLGAAEVKSAILEGSDRLPHLEDYIAQGRALNELSALRAAEVVASGRNP